jgi:hypothetical protein
MQTIEMSEYLTKKQIHCKLTYKEQIRRFIFHGTEFSELRGHISNLLSLPFDGFVLKYVDNESDLITLTSNEDLSLALDISDKILRLVVESPTASLPSPAISSPTKPPELSSQLPPVPPDSFGSYSFRSGHGGHYRGHHHHYHGGGGYHGPGGDQRGQFQPEKAKFRIQSKIDYLKLQLEQNPQEDWKRQNLLMKIHRLEGRLLRWESIQEKKLSKKKWKEEKKWKKNEQKSEKSSMPLSPESLQQIQTLKAQIASLKPLLYQLKVTKKLKKTELELSLQSGQGDKDSIWNEILQLKESINETQKQILSLKDQIRATRGYTFQ